MARINVTQTFLPPLEEYQAYLLDIWSSGQLTNQGPLLLEFEKQIKSYLEADNFHFLSNGTIALQLVLRALDITEGEIITTPFSYVATTSSILWERCTPIFVDIDPNTLCIDPNLIEAAITEKTKAIMAVHVFGSPCDVEAIELIAKRHDLKVIYDAAHAFGVEYKGRKLLTYGDVSTCSFHATKLFHTIEGGGIVTNSQEISDRVELLKRFGHNGDEHYMLGINAKANEFQAAMGIVNLKYIDELIKERQRLAEIYDSLLEGAVVRPKQLEGTIRNYIYYPVILKDESTLLNTVEAMNQEDIFPRRYFYPSLNTLEYLPSRLKCPTSEATASTILCLPMFNGLKEDDIERICGLVKKYNAS